MTPARPPARPRHAAMHTGECHEGQVEQRELAAAAIQLMLS
jgi:hypothetical protein